MLSITYIYKTESSYWHHLHLTRGILGKNSLSCSCMKHLTPEGTETHQHWAGLNSKKTWHALMQLLDRTLLAQDWKHVSFGSKRNNKKASLTPTAALNLKSSLRPAHFLSAASIYNFLFLFFAGESVRRVITTFSLSVVGDILAIEAWDCQNHNKSHNGLFTRANVELEFMECRDVF